MGYKDFLFQVINKEPFPWCQEQELQWGRAVTTSEPVNQLRSLTQSPAHKFLLHKPPMSLAKVQVSHQPRPGTKQVRKPMPTGLLQVVTLAQVWCANYFRWETQCHPPWDKHRYLYPKERAGWGFRAAFITMSAIYYFTLLFILLYYFTRFFYPPPKRAVWARGKVQGYMWTHVIAVASSVVDKQIVY